MIRPFHPACGVDMGATLAKVALRHEPGPPELRLLPVQDLESVLRALGGAQKGTLGLTGGGGTELALRFARSASVLKVNEFAAWGAGARALLRRSAADLDEPFLLVSVGTGTSAMLVDGMSVSRVGGTALGGGTVLGLGRALLGPIGFDDLCELARRGSRRCVDLLVSDIYGPGQIPLKGDLTAANFGRLAQSAEAPLEPADLAAGVMGLVGENVALITAGLALSARVRPIVFAGSTLRGNPVLAEVLLRITALLGRHSIILEDGEFCGALGALELAARHET
jgi:type II pantothenate kinase